MALSDAKIKAIKPSDTPRRITDEKGLYLEVAPSGGKWWRFKFRIDGKEKRLSFGTYPEVGLKEARERRDEARKLVAAGTDPGEARKREKSARIEATENTFEIVAREWFGKQRTAWVPSHGDRIMRRLERDIFPWLGSRPVAEISAPEILATVRRIEARGRIETAHRAIQNCGQIFRYGIATGRLTRDPTPDLRGALPPSRETHMAAVTDPAEVGALLRAIDGFRGTFVVQSALRVAPLVFVRPGELRAARWADMDLEAGEWHFWVSKTKQQHIVPLSRQALAILRELHPLTGKREHVFPGAQSPTKPMSEAAINAALRRMGYDTKTEITGHGFRAMARTLLHEELGFKPDVIEHQLAHRVPDALGATYNRTRFLKDRRTMMQKWADYLDRLKAGAEVILLPRKSTP